MTLCIPPTINDINDGDGIAQAMYTYIPGEIGLYTGSIDYTADEPAEFFITSAVRRAGPGFLIDWRYADIDGDGTIEQNEILGTLNGQPFYTLKVNDDGTYAFTLLQNLSSSESLSYDGTIIKAGAPSTAFIEVGLNSDNGGTNDAFVQMIAYDGNKLSAINESNAFVGVKNGNLDKGESIVFRVVDEDSSPALGGETFLDVTKLTIDSKTGGQNVTYRITAYNNTDSGKSQVFTYDTVLGSDAELVVQQNGIVFDEVKVEVLKGNAVKLGLAGLEVETVSAVEMVLNFDLNIRNDCGTDLEVWRFMLDTDQSGRIETNAISEHPPTSYPFDWANFGDDRWAGIDDFDGSPLFTTFP